jgi:hypothetical protein
MGRREMTVFVLDEVQELDQQVATSLGVSQQAPDLVLRRGFDLAAFRDRASLAATGARMAWLVRRTLAFRQETSSNTSWAGTVAPRARQRQTTGAALPAGDDGFGNLGGRNVGHRFEPAKEFPQFPQALRQSGPRLRQCSFDVVPLPYKPHRRDSQVLLK